MNQALDACRALRAIPAIGALGRGQARPLPLGLSSRQHQLARLASPLQPRPAKHPGCRAATGRPETLCTASGLAVDAGAAPQQSPLSPWVLAARLLGAAVAVAAWAFVASTTQASLPGFASLSVAAGSASSSEGLRTAVKSAWAGLAAGCLHTLAGADHLAALTPLTIGRSQLKASLLGALWGFGHSTGQLILGLLMVVLKDRFQQLVPALSKWGGTTVGLTLLAIGGMGLYESFFESADHSHHHPNPFPGGEVEMQDGVLVARGEKRGFGLATFATGIVYGLQPDALFVIIPALALPTKLAATAYIFMFVAGTVAAMGAYTGVIGATSAAIKKTNSGLTQKLSGIASFVAIAIGLVILLSGWGVELPFSLWGLGH